MPQKERGNNSLWTRTLLKLLSNANHKPVFQDIQQGRGRRDMGSEEP